VNFAVEYETRLAEPSDIAQHLPRLFDEASVGNAQIIELGVRSGNSTAAFLAAVEMFGGHVWSVDIKPPKVPPQWWQSSLWSDVVGSDLDVVDMLPDNVDIVFIDTSHHYRHTLDELRLYAPKVKPGGRILLHDTELERPDDQPYGEPTFPVACALREWAAVQGITVEWVPGCNGLGVAYIPED